MVAESLKGNFFHCFIKRKGADMYQALYRSFRPETFDAILGQEHIVRILQNQLTNDTTSHAYLFCGTRGTGKTSTARILAKGVNCLAQEGQRPCGACAHCQSIKNGSFMDVIEIDAASNNGVENIRELRESVKYPPVMGRMKVYIIDEVHMLSTGAFNALLKTLEEPPENVMFILATTEVHKLPATILSRCLRLDFHRVSEKVLKEGMRVICTELGVQISDAALGLVASNADGSVRDGLSLLDQCIAGNRESVTRESVLELLGTAGEEIFLEMTDHIMVGRVAESLLLLNRILEDGKDVRQFMKDWVAHFRSLMLIKYVKKPEDLLNMSSENIERLRAQSERMDLGLINQGILVLSKALNDARWSTQPRILLELSVVRLASGDMSSAPVQRAVPKYTSIPQPAGSAAAENTTVKQNAAVKAASESGAAHARDETPQSFAEAEAPLDYEPDADLDLDELWYRVFEEGEAVQGSFNLLRSGSKICHMDGQSFTIQVSNEVLKKYAKENAGTLERLMAKHTGRQRHMVCILESGNVSGGKSNGSGDPMKALADSLEKRLGLSVEIE